MHRAIRGVFLSCALLAGCDGGGMNNPSGSTATAAQSTGATGTGGAGGAGQGGQGGESTGKGGGGGQGGGSVSDCPAETICFDVKAVETGAIEAGRVTVLWFQLNDDGPDPLPLIAYDELFDPNVTRVEIPIASIAIPGEELLLCKRMCDDEAICPCLSDPKVGVALVFVVKDADNNGSIDFPELGDMSYGAGRVAIGYCENEYLPTAPPEFAQLFTDGIEKGMRPYRIVDNMGMEALSRTEPDTIFVLNVCDAPSFACDADTPDLN